MHTGRHHQSLIASTAAAHCAGPPTPADACTPPFVWLPPAAPNILSGIISRGSSNRLRVGIQGNLGASGFLTQVFAAGVGARVPSPAAAPSIFTIGVSSGAGSGWVCACVRGWVGRQGQKHGVGWARGEGLSCCWVG
jgi:hypothetical protein